MESDLDLNIRAAFCPPLTLIQADCAKPSLQEGSSFSPAFRSGESTVQSCGGCYRWKQKGFKGDRRERKVPEKAPAWLTPQEHFDQHPTVHRFPTQPSLGTKELITNSSS